jgi:hypothetical protein
MPRREINGAELHYELQGSGPPVLLVMGGTGDGGHFATLAPLLADEFTVVTYRVQAAGRLAERFGTEVTRTPGTHAAYHDHPDELAQTLRPFLRSATSS